ncbi:MAG: hypothetical protein U1E21_24095 [Reyranellaceae bacterium]
MPRMIAGALGCAAMLMLAGCSSDAPPVVQVSGSSGGMSAQTIADQLTNMQSQINELQQQVDALRQKAGQ